MRPNVLIRKYTDRRLYDTGASRYVKLKDIARLVREGSDVRVVDARSGKDLTAVILTQIVVEDARKATALPLQLLRELVRASDRATHEFLSWYLNNALDLYQKTQATVRTRLGDAKTAATSPLEFLRRMLAGQPRPSPAADAGAAARLRRRIEELEARLAQVEKPPKPARRGSTRRRRA